MFIGCIFSKKWSIAGHQHLPQALHDLWGCVISCATLTPCIDALQSSVLKEMSNIPQMLSFSCPPLWKQPGVLFGKGLFLFLMYVLLSLDDWGGKFGSTSCSFPGRWSSFWLLLFPVGAGCQNYLPQHYVVTCKDIIPGTGDATSSAGTLVFQQK